MSDVSHSFEEKTFKKDKECKFVIGIDDCARGNWAGDVFLVAFAHGRQTTFANGVRDSKKVTKPQMNKLFPILSRIENSFYTTVRKSPQVIDEINIREASLQGMTEAAEQLIDLLLVKGYITLDNIEKQVKIFIDGKDVPKDKIFKKYATEAVIKGDSKCYSIACASILAKHQQRQSMLEYDEIYPKYGFETNCGYGTPQHIAALKKYGTCKIHRMSYKSKELGELDLLPKND